MRLPPAAIDYDLGLSGQYYDVETGFHYNYFLDYDPEAGRYVQSDPIGLTGGLNTFEYAMANPLNVIDPKGLMAYPTALRLCQESRSLVMVWPSRSILRRTTEPRRNTLRLWRTYGRHSGARLQHSPIEYKQ